MVAPITSNKRGHGLEVELLGTTTSGAILCHQARVIDFEERGCKFLEKAPDHIVQDALAKVRLLVT